jgi:hypothetical protein
VILLAAVRLPSGGPNWFGSPQHVVGGAALAFVFVFGAKRLGVPVWLALTLAIALTSTAELLLERAEYVAARPRFVTAYYDTLADMASSFVGAALGGVVGASISRARSRA